MYYQIFLKDVCQNIKYKKLKNSHTRGVIIYNMLTSPLKQKNLTSGTFAEFKNNKITFLKNIYISRLSFSKQKLQLPALINMHENTHRLGILIFQSSF